jgi:N,N'-diacetyllegionaminate synthase
VTSIKLTDAISIGDGFRCFVIAEAGVNHNGDLDRALEMVDVAAAAGADAVKFQTFKTESIITRTAPKAQYHIDTTGDDSKQSWFELLKTQELTEAMHVALINRCRRQGIVFCSTPYDVESVDLLHRLDVPLFKVASSDANNVFLLEYMADKKRPMILSTAMMTMEEIELSVAAIRGRGLRDLVVLQCTGDYPSADVDANLRAMRTIGERFGVLTGYSDHVPGTNAAVAAIALGACVYEKHFTLDRNLPGPDHRASLEPAELAEVISAVRSTERMLGDGVKRVMPSEEKNRGRLRKSIVAARALSAGTKLGRDDVRVVRAGGQGMPAHRYHDVLGRTINVPLAIDEPISADALTNL